MKTIETSETPSWAIAKVNGVRAERFFETLDDQLRKANRAYSVFHQTYQMTHLHSFRDAVQNQADKIRQIRMIIRQNCNLYYIITKGFSLN